MRGIFGQILIAVVLVKALAFIREKITAHYIGISDELGLFLHASAVAFAIITVQNYVINWRCIPIYRKESSVSARLNVMLLLKDAITISQYFLLFAVIGYAVIIIGGADLGLVTLDLKYLLLLLMIFLISIPINAIASILCAFANALNHKFVSILMPAFMSISVSVYILISTFIFGGIDVIGMAGSTLVGIILYVILIPVVLRDYLNFSIHPKTLSNIKIDKRLIALCFVEFIPQLIGVIEREVFIEISKSHSQLSALGYALNMYAFMISMVVLFVTQIIYPNLTKPSSVEKNKLKNLFSIFFIVSIYVIIIIGREDFLNLMYYGGKIDLMAISQISDYFFYLTPLLIIDSIYSVNLAYQIHLNRLRTITIASMIFGVSRVIFFWWAVEKNSIELFMYGYIFSGLLRLLFALNWRAVVDIFNKLNKIKSIIFLMANLLLLNYISSIKIIQNIYANSLIAIMMYVIVAMILSAWASHK